WWPTHADDLLYWLVEVPRSREDREVLASCLVPLAAPHPLDAAALAGAARQTAWQDEARLTKAGRNVGGQVYPPIHAFLYAPFALLPPDQSYRASIIVASVFAFLAGLGITMATRGGVWWPVATLLVFSFPGFSACQCLGHNGAILLTFLTWGYYFLQKNA